MDADASFFPGISAPNPGGGDCGAGAATASAAGDAAGGGDETSVGRGRSLQRPSQSSQGAASVIALKPPGTLASLAGLLGQQPDTSPSLSLKGTSRKSAEQVSFIKAKVAILNWTCPLPNPNGFIIATIF